MKKIILAITVAAFTFGAYAGGDACCAKEKAAACAAKDKVACAAKSADGKCAGKCVVKKVESPKGKAASQA